jgi:hypothetical protein
MLTRPLLMLLSILTLRRMVTLRPPKLLSTNRLISVLALRPA